MDDWLKKMWDEQAVQQRDLGMDPRLMNSVVKRAASGDLILCLHEEVSELQRASSRYKAHILNDAAVDSGNVAGEIADVLKLVFAIAQLHGLAPEDVAEAFHRKTMVTRAKADGQRVSLLSGTKVLCVDLDDVLCDLSPWTGELEKLRGGAPPNARTLQMMEAWKDDWYKSGRFMDMTPVPGAVDGMVEMKRRGFKLVIITARPQWQYKRIHADTLGWLQAHNIPHDLILFNKDKVEAIYEHIVPAWPTAFVEDHERNARHLSAAGVPVLLFDQPHNRGMEPMDGIQRVAGWTDVMNALEGK